MIQFLHPVIIMKHLTLGLSSTPVLNSTLSDNNIVLSRFSYYMIYINICTIICVFGIYTLCTLYSSFTFNLSLYL